MSDELIMKNTILDWTPKVLRVNLMLYLIIGWGKELLPEWLPLIWGEASNKYCEQSLSMEQRIESTDKVVVTALSALESCDCEKYHLSTLWHLEDLHQRGEVE
jgi:hypothetical protein